MKIINKLIQFIKDYYKTIIITFLIFWIFNSVIFQFGVVPTSSMSPTADKGTIIVGNRLAYLTEYPENGDIVVFKSNEEKEKLLFKRVIGISGDSIEFKDGKLYRNSILMKENYLHESKSKFLKDVIFKVPKNSAFVLGDNRSHSADSRYWINPYIDYNDISSKVFLVIPFGDDCETEKITLLE